MSLFRRKPAPVPPEGPSWASFGSGKHARSPATPADATGPAATAPGSHRAGRPSADAGDVSADQV